MSALFFDKRSQQKHTTTLTITSGKGGVGKSTLVANLALWLGRRGNKVLILDGDLGMANQDIMFGTRAVRTIHNVIEGEVELKDIVMEVDDNVFLIPGGSGIRELGRLTDLQRRDLLDQVSQIPNDFDYFIVDTAPGLDDTVLYLNSAVQDIYVVVTPDPSSLADSYALIKVLNQTYKETRFSIVTNMVRDEAEGLAVFRRLSDVASRFLCVSLDFKGSILNDAALRSATKAQQLIVKTQPQAISSLGIRSLAQKLKHPDQLDRTKGGVQVFWEQVFGVA